MFLKLRFGAFAGKGTRLTVGREVPVLFRSLMIGLTLAMALVLGSPTSFAWTLNDVSVLLPLPKAKDIRLLLGAEAAGAGGALLPREVFDNLPLIAVGMNRREIYGQHLRVVAIRIDPCFLEKGTPYGCRKQLRLVWQPVLASGEATVTVDAAIHSFYDLNEDEWARLIRRLEPLAGNDPEEELDVHPRIRAEGLGGAHWTALRKIIVDFAGTRTITRATAMTVDTLGSIWTFSGVNIEGGVMTRIRIPRVNHIAQGFFADITDLKEFRTSINPFIPNEPAWMNLATNSPAARERMSEDDIRAALEQAYRIENPRREDTASMDCVSCHIAQSVRMWGERNFAPWKPESFGGRYFGSGTTPLKNNSVNPGFVNRLRAFGYFVDEPAISQRLIHESAEVLSHLRRECEDQLR